MTTSKPDVQALIMRALELSRTWRNTNGDDPEPCEVLLADMTAALVALSALSGEAEVEWVYAIRLKGRTKPFTRMFDSLEGIEQAYGSRATFTEEEMVRRRLEAEWEVVV